MKRFLIASIAAAGLLFGFTGSASAQTTLVAGNVWQVNSEGVYIENSNGVTYVRNTEANFYVNGVPVDFRYLGVGQPISAYANHVIYQGQSVGYQNSPGYQYNPGYPASPSARHPYKHDNRKKDKRYYYNPYQYRR